MLTRLQRSCTRLTTRRCAALQSPADAARLLARLCRQRMLYTWGEAASFTFLASMVVIVYYNIYLALLKMEQIDALF